MAATHDTLNIYYFVALSNPTQDTYTNRIRFFPRISIKQNHLRHYSATHAELVQVSFELEFLQRLIGVST